MPAATPSTAIDDYLKTIYHHTEWQNDPVTPSQLAATLGLAPSTVTEMVQKLAAAGARLALPVVSARGKSLIFRAWSPNDRLVLGSLGIPEPSPAAAELIPDIMLVPLAAFDRAGHRIGYGAGHYDHTFAHLRKSHHVTGIGLAFSVQETPAIPALSHDVALDFVLTEKDVFDFRSK